MCSIAEHFYELCRILMSPYTKRLIRDLLSNTPNCYVRAANLADIYLRGMRDRSMVSGTELAREIQLTDWSTAGEQGQLVFLVSTNPSLAQFISLFTAGKSRLSIAQSTHQFKFFTLRFLSRKNVEKKFLLTSKNFFRNFNPICRLRVARKPVQPVFWSSNTAWYLYSFWALFVLYEEQLDNNLMIVIRVVLFIPFSRT